MQDPIAYTVVLGKPLAGKTIISNLLAKHLEFKIVDVKAVEEIVKKKLGTEDEPFDGTPPIDKIENEIIAIFEKDRSQGKKFHYLFDSHSHPNIESFA
jgi:shikimate kinase